MADPFDFSQFGFEEPNFEMPDFEAIQQGQVQGQQGQGAVSNGGEQPGPTPPPSTDLGGGFGNFDFGNMFGGSSNGGGATSFLGGGGNDFLNNFLNGSTPTIPSFNQPAATPAPEPTPAAPAPAAPAAPAVPQPAKPKPKPKPKPAPAPAPAPKPAAPAKDDGPEYQAFDRKAWEAQYDKDNPFSSSSGSGEGGGPKTRMRGESGGGNRMAGQGLTNIMTKDQFLKSKKKRGVFGGDRYAGMTKQEKHNSQNDAYNKYRANIEARNNHYTQQQEKAQTDHEYAKKSAMYEAMDAHKEKYGERPEDAAWKAFDEKAFKERFDHENRDNADADYDSALSQAKSDYTAKYGDGGEIGKLTQMVQSLQAQLGEGQSRGQSGDGGYSNHGSNLGMGGDSQAATRAVGENGGGSSSSRQGAGGRTYRSGMQANTGAMRNPSSGKQARERVTAAKSRKQKR